MPASQKPGRAAPLFVVGLLTLLSRAAAAGEIDIQIEPGAGANFAAQAGVPFEQIQSVLKTELEALYRASGARQYVQAFGDAQAFSNKGLGADYASNPKSFIIGLAANVSANTDEAYVSKDNNRRPPVDGIGANFSVMAGTNLHWAGLRPLTIYGNYFSSNGAYKQFEGKNTNFGFHAQVKLFENVHERDRSVSFSWGGIDVTSGIEYGRLALNLTDTLKNEIPLTSDKDGPAVEATSQGVFRADMRVWSVPVEVTTNVRLFYLLSLYGGVGFDWQFGGSNKLTMNLDSDLLGTAPGVTDKVDIGKAKITATEDVAPSAGKLRALVGVQANLAFLRLFTHLNVMPDRGLIGVVAGVRLAF